MMIKDNYCCHPINSKCLYTFPFFFSGSMVCFCHSKDADDKTFLFPLMFVLIDASQLMIMPLAMFPRPW